MLLHIDSSLWWHAFEAIQSCVQPHCIEPAFHVNTLMDSCGLVSPVPDHWSCRFEVSNWFSVILWQLFHTALDSIYNELQDVQLLTKTKQKTNTHFVQSHSQNLVILITNQKHVLWHNLSITEESYVVSMLLLSMLWLWINMKTTSHEAIKGLPRHHQLLTTCWH